MTTITPDDLANELDVDVDELDRTLDLRGLVLSGGRPYIMVIVEDERVGGVAVTSQGIDRKVIPEVFRDLAGQMQAEA